MRPFKYLFAVFVFISMHVFAQETNTVTPASAVAPASNEEPASVSTYSNPEHSSEDFMGLTEGWFLGADFGSNLFYGDVALYNSFPKIKDFKKSFGYGYSIYGGKKFKFGLAAEIQLFGGTLRGEKRSGHLYPRYFRGDVLGYSLSAKYNLSQLVFRDNPGRKFWNRLTVYITVGCGQVFFRSRLYKYVDRNDSWYLERVSGYTTTGIDSAGPRSGGGLVVDKSKYLSAIIIPAGSKINFKLNQKTNLVLDFYYVTALTDHIDSWVRDWSHKDRFLYTGLGVVYNFGTKVNPDIPQEDRLLRPKDKDEKINDAYDDSLPDQGKKRTGLFNRKKSEKKDKDLELRMKMYELQLKIFEMQYLSL